MTSVLQSQHEHYAEVRRRLYGGPVRLSSPKVTLAVVETPAVDPVPPPTQKKAKTPIAKPEVLPPSSWRPIAEEVCAARKVRFEDVVSTTRFNDIVMARHEIWLRMRNELHWSYPRIGAAFGPFNHTTVISGIRAHVERKSQPGIPRVWKGGTVDGYVSQTAAVMTLLSEGKSPVQIVEITGLTKKQVSSVLSDQHKRARMANAEDR